METTGPVHFDTETVLLLRDVLNDAWASLTHSQRAAMNRTLLGEHILKAVAAGERDRERLLDAALMVVVA